MNTYELLDELSKKPKVELEMGLVALLLENKIDYVTVSNMYMKALNHMNDDKLNQLVEAETCVLQNFFHKLGGRSEVDRQVTQRSLYLLNKSGRFNMHDMNEKYHYDEAAGREASWYERNKRS